MDQMQERLWVILESQAYAALFTSSRVITDQLLAWSRKIWLPVIFPLPKTSCKTEFGTVSPATYIKCSMGWNSSSHMLKRQPWMRESSVPLYQPLEQWPQSIWQHPCILFPDALCLSVSVFFCKCSWHFVYLSFKHDGKIMSKNERKKKPPFFTC